MNLAHRGIWQAAMSLAVAAAVWLVCRRGSFEAGMAAVLVGGILVAPHAYLSDCAMAVPALLITPPLAGSGVMRNSVLFLHPAWVVTAGMLGYLGVLTMRQIHGESEAAGHPDLQC